jgi:hypothetical protein
MLFSEVTILSRGRGTLMRCRFAPWLLCALVVFLLCQKSFAQEAAKAPPSLEERMTKAETNVSDAALAGHNAWMLTSSALVLFMTAPGLAMFYSGLVRKKNVLGVMMQCLFLMGLLTVIWGLYGYSLAFGGTNPYIGNGDYLFMKGVERYYDAQKATVVTPMFNEGQPYQIPRLTHMLFQGMFFIITPALICGAFAERMKFSTMVVFMLLWGTIVYCPLAHWVWGGGMLTYIKQGAAGNSLAGGALDFAGGTVVHISSGVSALICALVMGKRLGYGSEPMPPHNVTYTVLGAAMLWVGWFGFNAGSELASDGLASSAFCVTHRGRRTFLGRHGMVHARQAERPGRRVGRGRRSGLYYSGFWLRAADAGYRHGHRGGRRLLSGLHQAEIEIWVRRFARCLWRSWHRRHVGRDSNGRVCDGAHL